VVISRSQLIGKKVYNPDGGYVGEVVDIGLALGTSQISLVVKTAAGSDLTVEWSNVGAAKDIIILKEAVEVPKPAAQPSMPAPSTAPVSTPVQAGTAEERGGLRIPFIQWRKGKSEEKKGKICPYCGQPATWIPQYQRWYCYNCQKYVE